MYHWIETMDTATNTLQADLREITQIIVLLVYNVRASFVTLWF